MKTKKLFIALGIVTFFLVGLLSVHVWLVTHKHLPDNAVAMARIDLATDINPSDAATISTWLAKQPGVEHVLCNPGSNIAIFSYYPSKVDVAGIVGRFSKESGFKGNRYMPSKAEMAAGCPVNAGSAGGVMNKIARYIFN